ncbi:MAG TPA: alcohol dehydrogenase catalytic domain-containing protein [Candidatus Limnocylindria bacterium]|nr:alcohol dehydrogenase catalytic domain-containing protein [Candidatus Limnocylindria bacterium]
MAQRTMRGIVKEQAGPGLAFRTDLPYPTIREDEALFKVNAAAVCGTDLHIDSWDEWSRKRVKAPVIIGHEVCGTVVEVGSKVTNIKPGDRVAVETHVACYDCDLCRLGMPHICPRQDIYGVTIPGGFAEYSSVRADVCVKLPDGVTDEMGAMLEPMGAGVHGVGLAKVKGKTVLVNGCGPIGLMAVGACLVHGAEKVIASDIFDEKLDVAGRMGAHVTLNARREDVPKAVKEMTRGLGCDAAIDYTGSGRGIVGALRSVRPGGMLVLVGLPAGEVPVNLTEDLIYREITVTGVAGRLMYETWEDCIRILQDPRFDIAPVIGGRYPLERYREAFDAFKEGAPGKMLLIPDMKG